MIRRILILLLLTTSLAHAEGVTKRVQFAPGTSSATIEHAVIRGERDTYILGASEGQKIFIRITSVEGNAVFDLYSPGEEPLGEPESTTLDGRLPESGDYKIVVGPTRGNATYTLKVTIK